jgi:hypothetical protein
MFAPYRSVSGWESVTLNSGPAALAGTACVGDGGTKVPRRCGRCCGRHPAGEGKTAAPACGRPGRGAANGHRILKQRFDHLTSPALRCAAGSA